MVEITAWKCTATGFLFEEKKSFLVHKCRRSFDRLTKAKRAAHQKSLEDRVAAMREMTSFAEIEHWLNTNGEAIFQLAHFKLSAWRHERKGKKKRHQYSLSNVKFTQMHWTTISATHCAPIGRKTSGWSKGKAETFSGWVGQISFRQKHWPSFASDVFKDTGINTGSGGGGDVLEYSVTLFAEDFPMLYEMMKQEGRLDPTIPYPLPVQPLPVLERA